MKRNLKQLYDRIIVILLWGLVQYKYKSALEMQVDSFLLSLLNGKFYSSIGIKQHNIDTFHDWVPTEVYYSDFISVLIVSRI